jgi:hypothetical protein
LASGPVAAEYCYGQAKKLKLSDSTVLRAKRKLKVQAIQEKGLDGQFAKNRLVTTPRLDDRRSANGIAMHSRAFQYFRPPVITARQAKL